MALNALQRFGLGMQGPSGVDLIEKLQRQEALRQFAEKELPNLSPTDAISRLAQISPEAIPEAIKQRQSDERRSALASLASQMGDQSPLDVLSKAVAIDPEYFKNAVDEQGNVRQTGALAQMIGSMSPQATGGVKFNPDAGSAIGALLLKYGMADPERQFDRGMAMKDFELKREAIQAKETKNPGGEKPPAGYRFLPDGSLEPIPGGPAEKIPAEVAARIGMAESYLNDAPEIRNKLKKISLFDRGNMALERGEASRLIKRVESGTDALRRNLTGAGMPMSEAQEYVKRYLPDVTDTSEMMLYKHDQLVKELESIRDVVVHGKGSVGDGASFQQSPAPMQQKPQKRRYNPQTGGFE